MPKIIQTKTIIIGSIAILLAVGLVFFRSDVSRFLSLMPNNNVSLVIEERNTTPDTSVYEPNGEENPQEAVASKAPVYTGRDPAEIRPNPDEVKGLSESQREKTYSDIGDFGRAVKGNPDFFFGWIQLGLLKKVIGDYEGARDAWEYAGAIRPENSVSFANLGELYWRYLPDYPRAEKNFLTAIKNMPDDSSTYTSLSDLYYYSYSEKKDQADDILLKGIAANPKDSNLMRWLASLYEREKKYSEALGWWRKVLALFPRDAAVQERISELEKK